MDNSEKIIQIGKDLGFDLVGITPVEKSNNAEYLDQWLKKGYNAEMDWISRGLEKRKDPLKLMPEAKTVIAVAVNYFTLKTPDHLLNDPSRGIIANYALINDYHPIILKALNDYAEKISILFKKKLNYKCYVDTGPVLERELAKKAGLGFIGKNNALINEQYGSYLFIGEMFIDTVLHPIKNKINGSCGTCQNCLNNCPTGALTNKNSLDSRKCVSYLTAELKEEIPLNLRPLLINRIYGCDACQNNCPWNGKAKATIFSEFNLNEDLIAPKLLDLAEINEEEFESRFNKSPIKRIKRRGLLRNVAIALGNWESREALTTLEKLCNNKEPLVRTHAYWAKSRIKY